MWKMSVMKKAFDPISCLTNAPEKSMGNPVRKSSGIITYMVIK